MRQLQRVGILAAAFVMTASIPARSQDPPPTPAEATTPAANPAPKSGATRYSHANDFLVRGTVFTEKAFAFPEVELRIRRTGEKKFHWQGYTNSRGEFAMRVPKGAEYEIVVQVKGFKEQVKPFDARNGMSEENVVFRMESLMGEKKQ